MLELLDELAERVDGAVLFICTTRPDLFRTRPDWGGGRRNFSSVPLDPLTPDESEQLITRLLDIGELPEQVRARILSRAEGNPFFLEEIIRRLIDEGRLERRNGGWRAASAIVDADVPDTVHGVILARLDLLTDKERQAAQQAAVVGRTFWSGAVSRLLNIDDSAPLLRTLTRRELIVERVRSSMAGEREYSFKHILVRDVAYESLPRKRRGKSHVIVARWIEEKSGARAEELAELLAHHYGQTAEILWDGAARRRALDYYRHASEAAMRRFALAQARSLGHKAVDMAQPGVERLDALEWLGDLCMSIGDGDSAYDSFARALEEARSSVPEDRSAIARLCAKAVIIPTRWLGSLPDSISADEIDGMLEEGLEAAGPGDGWSRNVLLSAKAFEQGMVCAK